MAERSASAVWLQAVSSEPSLRGTVTAAVSFVLTESAWPNAFSKIAHPGTTQGISDELSTMAGEMLADSRTGKNGRHALVGMLRQSVFGRRAGYEMLTMPNGYAMIRRCVRLSAARQPRAARHRQARWGVLRRAGWRRKRTYRHWLIFPANGSSVFMIAVRREESCWTWIRA